MLNVPTAILEQSHYLLSTSSRFLCDFVVALKYCCVMDIYMCGIVALHVHQSHVLCGFNNLCSNAFEHVTYEWMEDLNIGKEKYA